jgi:hypothetical protein
LAAESRNRCKWLNVVLDISGILCHCVDKSTARRQGFTNNVSQHEFSSTTPTVVGPKGVFTRPGLHEFLSALPDFVANIVIWSPMRRSTVEQIVDFLFHELPRPYDVLAQESCTKIEPAPGKFLTYIASSKDILLKILPDKVFTPPNRGVRFNRDNTLLIDDSPEKSICNESGNAIFLDSWNRRRQGDRFLMDNLTPWLRLLHSYCRPGQLAGYVNRNRIGRPPLHATSALAQHILRGMQAASRNCGANFDVAGIPGVIMPRAGGRTR